MDADLLAATRQASLTLLLLTRGRVPRSEVVGLLYPLVKKESALRALERDRAAVAQAGVTVLCDDCDALSVSSTSLVSKPTDDDGTTFATVRLAVARLLAARARGSAARDVDALQGAAAKLAHTFDNPIDLESDGGAPTRSSRARVLVEGAIDGRHRLRTTYTRRDGTVSQRLLEPHYIYEVPGRSESCYLRARDVSPSCDGQGDIIKVFLLSRMKNISVEPCKPYQLISYNRNDAVLLSFCIPSSVTDNSEPVTVTMGCSHNVWSREQHETLGKGSVKKTGDTVLWTVDGVRDIDLAARWAIAHGFTAVAPEAFKERWVTILQRAREAMLHE